MIAAGWLIGEIRAFFKLRLHLPLPNKVPSQSSADPKMQVEEGE
jgi:hypothetical protein